MRSAYLERVEQVGAYPRGQRCAPVDAAFVAADALAERPLARQFQEQQRAEGGVEQDVERGGHQHSGQREGLNRFAQIMPAPVERHHREEQQPKQVCVEDGDEVDHGPSIPDSNVNYGWRTR